jgi:hypothetical protein
MTSAPKLTIVAFCLLAAGCAPYVDPEAARREQERLDHDTCIGYGTVQGSPAYDDCRRDLALNNNSRYNNDPYYYNGHYDDRYDRYDRYAPSAPYPYGRRDYYR